MIQLQEKRIRLICFSIILLLCGIGQDRLFAKAGEDTESVGKVEEKVHLRVDNQNTYEGMNAAFSKGYLPNIQNNKAEIIVPFVADGRIKNSTLTASVDLGDSATAPFVFKKYEKTIKKKVYTFGKKEVEAYVFRCKIDILEEPGTGQYPVTLHVSGFDAAGNEITLSCMVYIKVEGTGVSNVSPVEPAEWVEDETNKTEEGEAVNNYGSDVETAPAEIEQVLHGPRFMIASDNVSGTKMQAGEKLELAAEFVNKSSKYDAYNLKITVSSNDENLLLKTSSYYEATVSQGGSFSVLDEIDIAKNTEQGTKILTYQLVYEDKNGKSYTDTAEVRFVVYQSVNAELKAFQLAETVTATETVLVNMQLVNESRAPIYNVSVSLEGEGLKPSGEVFFGNMEAGSAVEGSMKLFISALGEGESYGATNGIVTIRYEDAYGEAYSKTYDCNTNILKPQIVSLQLEEEKEETNQWWISVVIMVILFLLLVNVICFLKIRHMRREEKGYESQNAS